MRPVSVLVAGLMTFVGGFLDAYTYLSHGVFATAQTGNVVLLTINIAQGKNGWIFVWPVLAFTAAVVLSKWIRDASPRWEATVISSTIAAEIVVLVTVGFLPSTIEIAAITVPIAALAGLQLGLFRSAGEVGFVSIATTGNLMRLAEAGYDLVTRRGTREARIVGIATLIVACFAAGALLGGISTSLLAAHAIWIAAVFQLLVLVFFRLDARTKSLRDQ